MPDGDLIGGAEFSALHTEIRALGTQVAQFAEKIGGDVGDARARLEELEQKIAQRGPDGGGGRSATGGSLGAAILGNADFRRFVEGGKRGSIGFTVPQSTMAMITTATTGGAGALLSVDRRVGEGDIVALPRRRLTIRALLAPGNTAAKQVEYAKETVFDNQARVVSEGGDKPESNIEFEPATAPVRKIATWVRASKEALDDAPSLQATIDTSLRYMIAAAEEVELLFGDATGEHLEGLVPAATAYAPGFTPTMPTMLDDILLAIAQSEQSELPATGIVINSMDYRRMCAIKDSEGRYIGAGPFGPGGTPMIWGLPAVPTGAMTEGSFLVGALAIAAQIFDREDANVQISTEDGSNFTTNKITILCEERLALAVRRRQALIFGQYSAAT
jgi:HK97 family phage major capsid protein